MNSTATWLTRVFARNRALLLTLALTAATEGTCFADSIEDCPQFLGRHRDNRSAETGLLDRWPTNGLAQLWEQSIGSGYSAPSVRNGLLVLYHRVGGDEIVEAMDAATGKTKWQHKAPSYFKDPFGYNNGPRCTPLLTSNSCFTFGAEGKLTCLSLGDGRVVWQRDTKKIGTCRRHFLESAARRCWRTAN